ncbi:MAG: hypothetical protein U0836_27530 [Pirellulales bacterium]
MSTAILVNPFFHARKSARVASPRNYAVRPAKFARLPDAPFNASPVPELTSLYHNDDAGPYGDRRYPGNCGGNLIRDFLV